MAEFSEDKGAIVLEGLDNSQREAVLCSEGPVLIVAGAGSGKTRVLTGRIAWLLARGTEPDRILALTFTKKAASEMKERIAAMVGYPKARRLYMGTFHSVFIRFLREYADRLGYPENFTIYDTSDQTSAVRRCLKEMQLDEKVYKPKDVLARISMAKNNLVTPEAYAANTAARMNDTHAKKPEIWRIYATYQRLLKTSGVMDFDDILLNMNILLRDFPDAGAEIAARFDYVMVDEYQDTNFAQYLILKKLSQKHRNLCVVGDDSQSIYAFRGAKIENILNFRKDYPDMHIFRLERNYRSTRTIVDAANSLIAKNEGRIPKKCFSEGETGDKIRLVQAYNEQEEALLIASSIVSRMQEDGAQYENFAILYRINSQSRAIEEALRKRNLPYMIYSGNSFFDRAEVKDMMAYFKLAANPADDESFRRCVNKPARGIGNTTVEALANAARTAGLPLLAAIGLENLGDFGLKAAAVNRLRDFAGMMQKYVRRVPVTDAYAVASDLAGECGLHASYKSDLSIESQSRAGNIEELVNSVKAFVEERRNAYIEELMAEGDISDDSQIGEADVPVMTLGDYLENISLLSAVDVDEDETNNKISLMTVHSAKGLEFPYVYVIGMEENIFPTGAMMASPADIEEERRLFYVALTRAKTAVSLSFTKTRIRNGKHEENAVSRFVREIDRQYIANPLPEKDFRHSGSFGDDDGAPARPFGSRFGSRGSAYGASGKVSYSSGRSDRPSRSETVPGARPVRPSTPAAPAIPDKDFEPMSVLDVKAGMRIEHNRFGFGVVEEITGDPGNLKAKIRFDRYGEKILLLQYARLRRAE